MDRLTSFIKSSLNILIILLFFPPPDLLIFIFSSSRHFEFKPALLLGIQYKNYRRGEADQEELLQELWRTTKAKLAVLLPTDHRRDKINMDDLH